VIVTILCIRFVLLPLIGIAVVHAAYGLGFLSRDPLYRYVLMVQFAVPPAMNIGTRWNSETDQWLSVPAMFGSLFPETCVIQEPWLSCSTLDKRNAP